MTSFKVDQLVEATVERILPFGVFVRLDDGAQAYIRLRELDLDADVDPHSVVAGGEKIRAQVISVDETGKRIELSRRKTMADPWPEFARRHRVGDVIRGEVRALHPGGTFVRIQPGISGFVPIEEMAPVTMDKPEEVLWVGDSVEAVITSIHSSRKRLNLSIKARMQQYDRALNASLMFAPVESPTKVEQPLKSIKKPVNATEKLDLKNAGPILIIENDGELRNELATWLRRRGIEVTAIEAVSPALLDKLPTFRVFFIDLNLAEIDGLEFIRKYRRRDCKAYICIMSSFEFLTERAEEIEAARISHVFEKPLDLEDVELFLIQAARGEKVAEWKIEPRNRKGLSETSLLQRLGINRQDRLQQALEQVVELVRAQTGLLFWLDPSSNLITIIARTGQDVFNAEATYGLNDSPVADVINEGSPVFQLRVTANARERFAKLLELLSFESCIGVPVPVMGQTRHTAFFFHSEPNAFSPNHLKYAHMGAFFLSALLTDETIHNRLRAMTPILLSGELAASFGHDISNKISSLEMEARNLADLGLADDPTRAQRMLELTLDMRETVRAFQQLRETKALSTNTTVDSIITQAIRLVRDLARKEKARIIPRSESNLPVQAEKSTLLQQVFLNIILNAIQQMAIKAKRYKWEGTRTLEISTSVKEDWVQVRFRDNGPGIHKEHIGRLFSPGFSTRGGSGLGLYIAQRFIQSINGRLKVEDTFIPLGTTFLVEFPCTKREGQHEHTGYSRSSRR